MLVSFVFPCYNEEDNVPCIYDAVRRVMEGTGHDFEMIFVDDGSKDGTPDRIRLIADKDSRVGMLQFSRNFGHQAALLAGLFQAKGDAVITMDGDLQHPPELIPEMLKKWQQGAKVVVGIRNYTEGISWFKRLSSGCFYRLLNRVGEIRLPAGAADFRLLDRQVVDLLGKMPERHMFLRGMVAWMGFPTSLIPYESPRRLHGETKYSLSKMLGLATTGLLSFSSVPLIWIAKACIYFSVLVLAYVIYVVVVKLWNDEAAPGWASTVGMMSAFALFQSLVLAALAAYVHRIFEEVKNRPHYIIRNEILPKQRNASDVEDPTKGTKGPNR